MDKIWGRNPEPRKYWHPHQESENRHQTNPQSHEECAVLGPPNLDPTLNLSDWGISRELGLAMKKKIRLKFQSDFPLTCKLMIFYEFELFL